MTTATTRAGRARQAPSPTAPARGRLPAVSPDDMLVFAAVARAGGIRRAAADLGIPRSTTSRQVERLERALGGLLVNRTTRRFEITGLGAELLLRCADLEAVIRESERIALRESNEPTGTLRVAASPLLGDELLAEPVADYLRRFPSVRVHLQLSVDFVDLRRTGVDIAFRTGPLQNASDLYAARLGSAVKGLYASPSYLKTHGTPSEPADLARHDCIVAGNNPRAVWDFVSRGRSSKVEVTAAVQADSYRLARSLAQLDAGILRVPRFYAQALVDEGKLVPVLEGFWPVMSLYAVHTAGQRAPTKIRAFIDLVRQALRKTR